MNQPYISDSFRWIEYDRANQRLKLTGSFTSDDLTNLAEWLWLEVRKPLNESSTTIDVKLSPTKP
jgi:hypothetical protein